MEQPKPYCEVPVYNFLASVLAKAAVMLVEALIVRLVQVCVERYAPQAA
ncbi:hypothetical protein GCM10022226_70110 [Sphaerisporangium flaviroseum]|uniref:Uncharacterized protein n=1 Tax=Sphaerisporangium flaviroseum TaxID=509199 RepID=A0ABP7J9V1_9ACTN